jgi:hypothetical protein
MAWLLIVFGLLIGGLGLAGYHFIVWSIARRLELGRPLLEWDLIAFQATVGALATVFVWYGGKLFIEGARDLWSWHAERGKLGSPEQLAARPWLRNTAWRRRIIVHGRPVGTPILLLAYGFFGLPALFLLWAGIVDLPTRSGESLRLPLLAMGGMLAFIVGGLTYWTLRHMRYGDSVCHLLTLPGVVGGWLKANVECKLPHDPEAMVTVRLRNLVQTGKTAVEVWRMEERVQVLVAPGERATVPVRLRVPRDPSQRPMAVAGKGFLTDFAASAAVWILEVEKRVPGIDYFASFSVPVYDTTNVPAGEQGVD